MRHHSIRSSRFLTPLAAATAVVLIGACSAPAGPASASSPAASSAAAKGPGAPTGGGAPATTTASPATGAAPTGEPAGGPGERCKTPLPADWSQALGATRTPGRILFWNNQGTMQLDGPNAVWIDAGGSTSVMFPFDSTKNNIGAVDSDGRWVAAAEVLGQQIGGPWRIWLWDATRPHEPAAILTTSDQSGLAAGTSAGVRLALRAGKLFWTPLAVGIEHVQPLKRTDLATKATDTVAERTSVGLTTRGDTIVTVDVGSATPALLLVDAPSGHKTEAPPASSGLLPAAYLAGDGLWLVTASQDLTQLRAWNADGGAVRAAFENRAGASGISDPTISNDFAVFGGNDRQILLDLRTGSYAELPEDIHGATARAGKLLISSPGANKSEPARQALIDISGLSRLAKCAG